MSPTTWCSGWGMPWPSTRSQSPLEGPLGHLSCGGCLPLYGPNREACIDAAMVAFKGRSLMKQYLLMKPVNRWFKIWMRADSHNGYISQCECYTGRRERVEVGLGRNFVERLTRDLVGENYHIYMDKFFSFVPLYKSLFRDKIYCAGTLRSNCRYFPSDLKPFVKKRFLAKKGDIIVRQEGNTCVLVWQDTRPVVSISTGHNPAETKVVKRGRGKKAVYINCPSCIF